MPNNPVTGQADMPETNAALKDAKVNGTTATTKPFEPQALNNQVKTIAEKSFNNPLFGAKK